MNHGSTMNKRCSLKELKYKNKLISTYHEKKNKKKVEIVKLSNYKICENVPIKLWIL